MAANLTGMFAQLNEAIRANPLETMGQGLMDRASKGFGGALGAATDTDPYSYMTEGAKKLQGRQELSNIQDLTTVDGMREASRVYGKMGDVEKATAMAQGARALKKEQDEQLEQQSEEQARELNRKRAMREAVQNGDYELARALGTKALDPGEYEKMKLASRIKTAETLAGIDPYRGAFTQTVTMQGAQVPVRFAANGEPIAILGEGVKDYTLTDVYNPAINGMQKAMVNKNNPQDIQFVGTGQQAQDEYEIKQMGDKYTVWMTPAGGGAPVRAGVYDNLSDAERDAKLAADDMRAVNLLATLDAAQDIINEYGQDWTGVGGISGLLEYLPGTKARELKSLVQSIKSNVGFDELRALKAEGGSLGQVSNIENILLQSAIANLDTLNSPEALGTAIQTIKEVKARLRRAKHSENPDALFTAQKDANGQLTGNKLYKINDSRIAVLRPDGTVDFLTPET